MQHALMLMEHANGITVDGLHPLAWRYAAEGGRVLSLVPAQMQCMTDKAHASLQVLGNLLSSNVDPVSSTARTSPP